jgi:hypothetical protein
MKRNARDLAIEITRELFPELCGKPIDLERYAVSIIYRALNDYPSTPLRNRIFRHYGLARVTEVAHARVDRLSNPAYRQWREAFDLPPRSPEIEFVQGLWMK